MAKKFYFTTALLGGETGALDAVAGNVLVDGDGAIAQTDGYVYLYYLDATAGGAEDSPNVIVPDTNPGTKNWVLQTSIYTAKPYILLHDSKPTGTYSGTFTAGSWQKRTCTESIDTHNLCSVASSVITLQAGTYDLMAFATSFHCRRHRLRLQNTSDASTTLIGVNNYNTDGQDNASYSNVHGRFTITAEKNFELQHYCTLTKTTNGLGVKTNTAEDEVFLLAEFRKVN